jgi:hypothetical protein
MLHADRAGKRGHRFAAKSPTERPLLLDDLASSFLCEILYAMMVWEHPVMALLRRFAKWAGFPNSTEIIRIDDDLGHGFEPLRHPLFDTQLDNELLDQNLHDSPEPDLRFCGYCGKETGSLKDFELPAVLFVPFPYCPYISAETEPISACPACMRWYITKFLLCNIVTANVLWPVVSLLPSLYLFARTMRKGHSRGGC